MREIILFDPSVLSNSKIIDQFFIVKTDRQIEVIENFCKNRVVPVVSECHPYWSDTWTMKLKIVPARNYLLLSAWVNVIVNLYIVFFFSIRSSFSPFVVIFLSIVSTSLFSTFISLKKIISDLKIDKNASKRHYIEILPYI